MNKNFWKLTARYAVIFTGGAATIMAPIFASKATLKAADVLNDQSLTKKEKFKKCAKDYIPTAAVTLTAIGCTTASAIMGFKAEAGLTAALAAAKEQYGNYRKSVAEVCDKATVKEIDKAMLRRYAEKNLIKADTTVGVEFDSDDSSNKIIIFDPETCKFVETTPYDLKCTELEMNRIFMETGECPLLTFYKYLSIPLTQPDIDDISRYSFQFDESGVYSIEFILSKNDVDGMAVYILEFNYELIYE